MLHVPPLALITPFGGGYVIEGSANFADAGANHHNWTPAGTGDSRTVMTVEAVFKLFSLATDQHIFAASDGAGNNIERLYIDATGNLHYEIFVGGVTVVHYETTALFRDFSAWYQVVVIRNGNTVTLYVNGTAVTAFDTSDAPTGDNGMFGYTVAHYIGRKPWTTSGYLDLAIARLTYQDGVAASISDYGKAVGNGWSIADASSLSLGTNGVQITGGTDMAAGTLTRAGTAHSVSKTGTITATNDSPTNSTDGSGTYGNYANFNDEYQIGSTAYNNATYSQGRTHATYANGEGSVLSQAVALGNGIYFEATLTTPFGSTFYDTVGFIDPTRYASTITNIQESPATGYSFFKSNGQKSDDGATLASYGSAWDTAGKVIGVYISTTGKVWYTIDGTLQNSATESEVVNDTGTSHAFTLSGFGQILPVLSARGSNTVWDLNCGQFAWNTTPYSGYAGLSTANLPAPAITSSQDHYYAEAGISHTNASTTDVTLPKSVSGGAMVRIKRTDSTGDWYVIDTVRGANNFLLWNSSVAEDTSTWTDAALSGTTLTLPSALATGTYIIEVFYVSEFFQIKTWTGTTAAQTVAWGTALDSFGAIWNKPRSGIGSGIYFQQGLTTGSVLFTDNSAAQTARANYSQDPDETDFRLEADATAPDLNTNGVTYVAYGWANSGPYKFGAVQHNNSTDGSVVWLGGTPQAYTDKRTDATTSSWVHWIGAKEEGNPKGDDFALESTLAPPVNILSIDMVSTGIKYRDVRGARPLVYSAYGIQPFGGDGVEQARAR